MIDRFDPIVGHIFKKVVHADYAALDATSMPVLDMHHPLGIRTSTLWLLQGERTYSFFLYAVSRHAHHLDNWYAFYVGQLRNRVPLPSYPFERTASWVSPRKPLAAATDALGKRSNVDDWFAMPTWIKEPLLRTERRAAVRWLVVSDGRVARQSHPPRPDATYRLIDDLVLSAPEARQG